MGHLDVNTFLTELTKLYEGCKEVGEGKGKAVTLSLKRTNLKPRKSKKKDAGEYLCLARASYGKKKISTAVSASEHLYFLNASTTICKAHMDSLKKRQKKKKAKKAKK